MQTQTSGSWLSSVAVPLAAVLVVALAPAAACAQPAAPRAGRIDGSSPTRFEASVASLQNELSPRRREDFEIALAVIWMSNTIESGDLDRDGDVDLDDIKKLEEDTRDLLTDIQRGDLLAAIETRGANENGYIATDYLKQLDDLGYDEVLSLADLPSRKPYQDALSALRAKGLCGRPRASRIPTGCDEADGAPVLDSTNAKALNTAIVALRAQKYAEARAALTKLKNDRLSPYERSKTEQILSSIAVAEQNYAEAREHLQAAIAAGGLNPQEVLEVQNQVRFIDSRLSANPP